MRSTKSVVTICSGPIDFHAKNICTCMSKGSAVR